MRFGFGAAVVVMGVASLVGSRLIGRRTVLKRRGNNVGGLEWSGIVAGWTGLSVDLGFG